MLFVLNRLANSLTGIDTTTRKVLWEIAMADPTPAAVRLGRGFLYDAKLSGNGTFACASCHVDGDIDGLAWDLGDRAGDMFTTKFLNVTITLHPMKGAMTTQSLKGLKGTGPFHWRGDKTKLQDFNGAFAELLGGSQLSAADMDAYVAFLETITYPPNPNFVGLNSPTRSTLDTSGSCFSIPSAQKQPLTIICRVPSWAKSCDAPSVVVKTRAFFPDSPV